MYNLGGGCDNSCSILEAFKIVESFTGKVQAHEYLEENRSGDYMLHQHLSKCVCIT